MDLNKLTVGFIGGGNMAKAIGEGVINNGVIKNSQIYVSAPSAATTDKWDLIGVNTTHVNAEVVNNCDIIFLAFKPHQLDVALPSTVPYSDKSKLFVSVLVGISTDVIYQKVTQYVQNNPRVIRSMPNTTMTIGEGCAALSKHSSATDDDIEVTRKMFSTLGMCEVVPEYLMTSIAALTGSGPAYIYMVIEGLSDGAVKQGVPREMATTLAAQTVAGAAKMVLKTNKHPAQLRDAVCSAGGTTICGVHALERGNIRYAFMDALEAATKRGEEIAKMNK